MEELERKVEEPGFWDRPEESQKLMKELKYLQELVKQIRELYRSYEDIGTLIEMGYEENDPEIAAEAERDLQKFAEVFEELKIQTLLSGEYDSCNAIVTIHAGAGGTESCDWGQSAVPDVQQMGGAQRVPDPGAGFSGRGYCGDQDGNL